MRVGVLVISLRGVNFGFWSHLGCSGQNDMIFSCEDLITRKKHKNTYIFIFTFLMRFIYSIHIIQVFSFVCVLTWSLLGVKKAWAMPRSVSFRGLIQNFRQASPPRLYAESPTRGSNVPPNGMFESFDGQKSISNNNFENNVRLRPHIFKRWILLSTGSISIQWITHLHVINMFIHRTLIYLAPVVQK